MTRIEPIQSYDWPNAYFVKPQCRGLLEQFHEQTVTKYYLDASHPSAFQYTPEPRRTYCGVPLPDDYQCQNDFMWDDSIVIKTDYPTSPPALSEVVEMVHDSTIKNFPAHLRANFIFYVLPEPLSRPTLRVFQDRWDPGTEARPNWQATPVRVGQVHFIGVKHRTQSETHENIRGSLERIFSRSREDAQNFEILDFVESQATGLAKYWQSSKTFLRDNPSKNDVPKLDFSSFNSSFNLPATANRALLNSVFSNTSWIISQASHVLAHSKDIDELSAAASIWWTARSAQLKLGCSSRTNRPVPDGIQLINAQYGHQSCRKFYVGEAVRTMNATIAKNDNVLILESPEWALAQALGSRRERANFFVNALTVLQHQMQAGLTISEPELSIIAFEILQTAEELRRRQVLTWNGFQPFSSDGTDERKIQDILRASSEFLRTATALAQERRIQHPAQNANFERVWAWTKNILNLPDLNQNTSSNTAVTALSRIESVLATSSRLSQDDIDVTLNETIKLAADHPEIEVRACTAWLGWINSHRRQNPNQAIVLRLRAPKPPEAPLNPLESCFGVATLWAATENTTSVSDPRLLEQQCSAGHWLSCLTWAYINRGNDPTTADKWDHLVFANPFPAQYMNPIAALFKSHLANLGRDRTVIAPWRRALVSIHTRLRQWAVNEAKLPPTRESFVGCIPEQTWNSLLENPPLRSHEENLTVNPSCPQRDIAKHRSWAVRLGVLKSRFDMPFGSSRPSQATWEENPASALARFSTWFFQLKPSLGPLRQIGPTFTRDRNHRFMNRLNQYLDNSAFADESQKDWWMKAQSHSQSLDWISSRIEDEMNYLADCERSDGFFCGTHSVFHSIDGI